jgi:hypothetical protein
MQTIKSRINKHTDQFSQNREDMLALLEQLDNKAGIALPRQRKAHRKSQAAR